MHNNFLNVFKNKLENLKLNSQNSKILCAMSGGVDSSCAAAICKFSGLNVEGATFKLFASNNYSNIKDAKGISDILRINHFTIDLVSEFKQLVIEPFVEKYLNGITPNPCITCNKNIKFGKVIQKALELGFTHVSTGHYANVTLEKGRYLVKKTNSFKDQSYCFYTLSQKQLSHILLPLAGFQKNDIRNFAKNIGLFVHDKAESQDICFINSSYSEYIKKYLLENNKKLCKNCGDIIDEENKILGQHNGIFNYTVGQRRRLGVSTGERMYVKNIDKENNKIILKKGEPSKVKYLIATELNFIPFDKLKTSIKVMARVRYNCKEVSALLSPINENKVKVEFEELAVFVTPGQSIVFYDDEYLVGGGIIESCN